MNKKEKQGFCKDCPNKLEYDPGLFPYREGYCLSCIEEICDDSWARPENYPSIRVGVPVIYLPGFPGEIENE